MCTQCINVYCIQSIIYSYDSVYTYIVEEIQRGIMKKQGRCFTSSNQILHTYKHQHTNTHSALHAWVKNVTSIFN